MGSKKIIWAVVVILSILGCDPSMDIKYYIKNTTDKEISITLYENNTNKSDVIFTNTEYTVKEVYGLGTGGFGSIGTFDSIKLVITSENRMLKWERPNKSYGYIDIDNNIGKDRNIGKDFYNRKYWALRSIGDEEEWTFIIDEIDLDLFHPSK